VGRIQRGERVVELLATTLVGRSPAATLYLSRQSVSRHHAEISWDARTWWIRDLGSKSGTWVDGQRLELEDQRELGLYAALSFGSQGWGVIDVGRPRARALGRDGRVVMEDEGVLVIPGADPSSSVSVVDHGGRWVRGSRDGELRDIVGRSVQIDDQVWRLELPTDAPSTDCEDRPLVSRVSWCFPEDSVRAWFGPRVVWESSASYVRLLRLLARARVGGADDGWIHRVDARERLACSLGTIDTYLHRARRDAADSGLLRGRDVVQARRGTGLIRFGGRRVVGPAPADPAN